MLEKSAKVLGVVSKELWMEAGLPILNASKEGFGEEKALDIVRNKKLSERELAFLVLVACNHLFGAIIDE